MHLAIDILSSPATMKKRVHFATNLAAVPQQEEQAPVERGVTLPFPSSRWYTSKELRGFRNEIHSSIDAEKTGNSQAGADPSNHCMRGLEIFASNVRRDLQKHYAKSVIEAQRRIKAVKKRKRKRSEIDGEDESVLLQRVATKYSQYARDRAFQIAARDEADSRRLYEESLLSSTPPSKKQCHPTPKRIFHLTLKSSVATRSGHPTPSRLGMPSQGR